MPQKIYGLNQGVKPWAFLGYLAADNNLSDAGMEDIREMCDVGASKYAHVGVEIDTRGIYDGSIRYEISEPDWLGHARRIVIERLPEQDSGDPESFRKFVRWGTRRFRAQNYIVDMWNHGSGFRSPRRDIGYDDFGSSLDMPELADALRRAGINSRHKIAILGFDACLMNMIEVVNHFENYAEIIVGSQETEPGDGWPYDDLMRLLKRPISKQNLAAGIVKTYIKYYRGIGTSNVTQSAVDVGRTRAAVTAVHVLGRLLANNFDRYDTTLQRIRLEAQQFHMADYVDLIHIADLISRRINHPAIVNAAGRVIQTTKAAIIASGKYGNTVRNAHGLSIWFPAQRSLYYQFRAKYLNLRCNTPNSGWVRFLERFHL